MESRNALLSDVEHIHAIIEPHAAAGRLLPRSIPELTENVRDFVVVQDGDRIVGCGALHLYGRHLAAIRSIAVAARKKVAA
jgi:amino-acid N-acetyltransferase